MKNQTPKIAANVEVVLVVGAIAVVIVGLFWIGIWGSEGTQSIGILPTEPIPK